MMLKNVSILVCILFGTTHVAAGPSGDEEKMQPCPDSPNCVSSISNDDQHFIKPFVYRGSSENARQKLIDILNNSRGVRLVSIGKNYLHAEFRSMIFRFVDDVEFYFPAKQPVVHVRSASRTGYYDFGVNRRRVERLRLTFEEPAK